VFIDQFFMQYCIYVEGKKINSVPMKSLDLNSSFSQLPRFHVPFWLSYILVYLFYFCLSFCLSWDRSIINKQSYG